MSLRQTHCASPTWDMGAKITIDSASLMNKGFEVIEARWLFGVPAEKIEVLIHPQSIVHSGVEFVDGGVKAQLGVPDMKLPIQYAFSYPDRLPLQGDRLDLFRQPLEFFRPDVEKFQCLQLAYESIRKGGNMPCIVNAANEIVNLAFREGRCSFLGMGEVIEKTMQRAITSMPSPTTRSIFRPMPRHVVWPRSCSQNNHRQKYTKNVNGNISYPIASVYTGNLPACPSP